MNVNLEIKGPVRWEKWDLDQQIKHRFLKCTWVGLVEIKKKNLHYVLAYVNTNVTLSVLLENGKFSVKNLWRKELERFSALSIPQNNCWRKTLFRGFHELSFASVSKKGLVQSHWFENVINYQFMIVLTPVKLIVIIVVFFILLYLKLVFCFF